jgi:hypothetical protein
VVPQGLFEFFPVFVFGDFRNLFLAIFLERFRGCFSSGFVWGCMHEPFMVLFPLIPLPNPREKGLDFGIFVVLEFVVFLAEILRFLLIQ